MHTWAYTRKTHTARLTRGSHTLTNPSAQLNNLVRKNHNPFQTRSRHASAASVVGIVMWNKEIRTEVSGGHQTRGTRRWLLYVRHREYFYPLQILTLRLTFTWPYVIDINNIDNQLDANNNGLLIIPTSSTCFGRWFRSSSGALDCVLQLVV